MKNLKIYIFIVIIIVAFIGSLIFKFFFLLPSSEGRVGWGDSAEAAAPRTGLVGWWTMDSNDMSPTGATLYDKSGNGNHGTVTGTTTSTGRIGQSRTFNGTNNGTVAECAFRTKLLNFETKPLKKFCGLIVN